MVDLDFAQATFEYALRKRIFDDIAPMDGNVIKSNDKYYIVDWKGVTLQQLWGKIVDKEHLKTLSDEEQFDYFTDCINNYIANLTLKDAKDHSIEIKFSDVSDWMFVKNVPKRYYLS